jgi:hypothetical protein
MKTQKQRAEERREAKLAEVKEQVEQGELVIRQMTPAERKKNPPKPRKQPNRRRR